MNVSYPDVRVNASLGFLLSSDLRLVIHAHNLASTGNSKRYAYDFGNDRASPRRIRLVEEPRVFGATLEYRF